MAYKFKNYRSVYRDPGSVFVNQVLRNRYDRSFAEHNKVQQNLEQMLVSAEFEGDAKRAQELKDQLTASAQGRVSRGDFENLSGNIAADVNTFIKGYTPLQRNFQEREKNKEEAQNMVMSGKRSSEWYDRWLKRSLMVDGEDGDYTAYTGLTSKEDGSIDPGSYYQRQAVSVDKKPAEEVLQALNALITEERGGEVRQFKEPRYVEGYGMVDYMVTERDGTVRYITSDRVREMVDGIMSNREDLRSFMKDKSDLNTFDMSSQELNSVLLNRRTQLQEALDTGSLSSRNKLTDGDKQIIQSRIDALDSAIDSDNIAGKRDAARSADYDNQYDEIMNMSMAAKNVYSQVGGGRTSQVDPLWLARWKAQQEAQLNAQINFGTPGSTQTIANNVFANEDGQVTIESLQEGSEYFAEQQNEITSSVFENGVSSHPYITGMIAAKSSGNFNYNLASGQDPIMSPTDITHFNNALRTMSNEDIKSIISDASSLEGYNDLGTTTPNDMYNQLLAMRNKLESNFNISQNGTDLLNRVLTEGNLSPNNFAQAASEVIEWSPEEIGSSQGMVEYYQPIINSVVSGLYNGIDEDTGAFMPEGMDNANLPHPVLGDLNDFLMPLLTTHGGMDNETAATIIDQALVGARALHSGDVTNLDDYGGSIKENTTGVGLRGVPNFRSTVVSDINDIVENGVETAEATLTNSHVSSLVLPEYTYAQYDTSKDFALSESFKKQLGTRTMDMIGNIPTAATVNRPNGGIPLNEATTMAEGAIFIRDADGNPKLATEQANFDLRNYTIDPKKTMFSHEIVPGVDLINTVIIAAKLNSALSADVKEKLPGTIYVEVPYDKLITSDVVASGGRFKDLMTPRSPGGRLHNEIVSQIAANPSQAGSKGITILKDRKGAGKMEINVKARLDNSTNPPKLLFNNQTRVSLTATNSAGEITNIDCGLLELKKMVNQSNISWY